MMDGNGTTQSLPGEREPVQFLVAGHTMWLEGTFREHTFHSRWACYLPEEIDTWRTIGHAPLTPPPSRVTPQHRYWSNRPMRHTRYD